MGWQMGLDRFLADRSRSTRRRSDPLLGIDCKARFNLYPPVTMTYREYNDMKNAILSAYLEGRIDPPDMRSKLADLNREYEGQSVDDYEARKRKIAKEYEDGEISYEHFIHKLADLDKEFKELENSRPASTFDNWTERAEEATRKMKERMHEIRTKWAHAYIYGDKVKIKKGQYGLPLVEMSVLEARLLANEILSITNKQRRKRK